MPKPTQAEIEMLSGPEGVVYLLDAATEYETRLLRRWLSARVDDPETYRIRSSRRRHGPRADDLSDVLDRQGPVHLIPVRVVWMARQKEGTRSISWSELLKPGDPRDPRAIRARLIRTFSPSRVKLVAAEGADLESLVSAYEAADEIDGLEAFVTRRAWRTLDQAERRLRGNRYKIPRFVPEAILSRGDFAEALDRYATETGTDRNRVTADARRYLREIAATHSPYVIDLIANAIHTLIRQGYGKVRYSEEEVRSIAAVGEDHPVVFLPSHRSMLDRLSLQFMLWENDLPPNHTAGGINMNFFPAGPLIRRTGVFFIRRTFRDNELYKIVLRAYIDFLVEKRFPLEWYMEGGRSRLGRLNPPRFGLLSYVLDAQRRGKSDDIQLIPVSIAYDQIQDIPDYAREAQGRDKQKESFGWMVKAIRSLRQRYGDIHIRFAEPVSVASVAGEIGEGDEASTGTQKLAFEVMYRIGRVTPVTPIAVVSIALLAARGKARTAEQLAADCSVLIDFIRARELPTTERLTLDDPSRVTYVLDWLSEHGNASSHEAIGRRVFWADDDQMIRISYYRNMVVHFFVNRAIAEISLASLVDRGERDVGLLQQRILDLRDLLKYEFFFPDKDQFVADVTEEIELDAPGWSQTLAAAGPLGVIAKMGKPVAHWALLPFLDAYQIVGDELEALQGAFDEKRFLNACLDRAKMYRIEEKVISGESVSQVLFKSALALAKNRDLLGEGSGASDRRQQFAQEVRSAREGAAAGLAELA